LRVLVTGGTGFIGTALVAALLARGFQVRIAGRGPARGMLPPGVQWQDLGDLAGEVDWVPALADVAAVVHLAGLAHRAQAGPRDDPGPYERVNHQATRSLVEAMRRQPGLERFLFASTVRVHGDAPEFPLTPDSPCDPATPYDRSKVAAEQAIREGLPERVRWAILRLSLVYGPGQKGNMAKLERMIRKGLPIPVTGPNRKSFLFVGNLVDAILTYLEVADPPSGRTWMVADDPPISTEDLVRALGRAMGRKARVVPAPSWLLEGIAWIGDGLRWGGLPFPWNHEVQAKLLGDFHVDLEAIRRELGWAPPYRLEEGLWQTYRAWDPLPKQK